MTRASWQSGKGLWRRWSQGAGGPDTGRGWRGVWVDAEREASSGQERQWWSGCRGDGSDHFKLFAEGYLPHRLLFDTVQSLVAAPPPNPIHYPRCPSMDCLFYSHPISGGTSPRPRHPDNGRRGSVPTHSGLRWSPLLWKSSPSSSDATSTFLCMNAHWLGAHAGILRSSHVPGPSWTLSARPVQVKKQEAGDLATVSQGHMLSPGWN